MRAMLLSPHARLLQSIRANEMRVHCITLQTVALPVNKLKLVDTYKIIRIFIGLDTRKMFFRDLLIPVSNSRTILMSDDATISEEWKQNIEMVLKFPGKNRPSESRDWYT